MGGFSPRATVTHTRPLSPRNGRRFPPRTPGDRYWSVTSRVVAVMYVELSNGWIPGGSVVDDETGPTRNVCVFSFIHSTGGDGYMLHRESRPLE